MHFNPIAGIVSEVIKGADALFTSDEERKAAELKLMAELNKPHILQALANIEEAKHPSLFVAGWRPALGWLCVSILGYAWIIRDFLLIGLAMNPATAGISLPLVATGELMTLVLALLGLGATRMYEKTKGIARSSWTVEAKK